MACVAKGKRMARSHRKSQSTKSLKSSSADMTICCTLRWDTNIFKNFLPIQRGLSTYPFPKFILYLFSNHVPSKFLTIQSNHWPQLISVHNHTPGHFSFQVNWMIRYTARISTHWEDFPSSLSRDSQKGAEDVYFWMMPAYHADDL